MSWAKRACKQEVDPGSGSGVQRIGWYQSVDVTLVSSEYLSSMRVRGQGDYSIETTRNFEKGTTAVGLERLLISKCLPTRSSSHSLVLGLCPLLQHLCDRGMGPGPCRLMLLDSVGRSHLWD